MLIFTDLGDVEPGLRSERLQQIRTATADGGNLGLAVPSCHGGSGRSAVVQALMQFICGYYDVDLRDSSGLGHGRLMPSMRRLHCATDGSRAWSMARFPGSPSQSRTAAAGSAPPEPVPLCPMTARGRLPG